jgi:hypothetical protein
MSKVQELLEQFNAAAANVAKETDATIAGNAAAGARVRKATQELGKLGKEIRKETLAAEAAAKAERAAAKEAAAKKK